MDPLSQAALGAAWAQPATRASRLAIATLMGGVAGMAPDLDVLIRSSSDPLLALEFHRQFTHSLAFIPVGALICALVLHRPFRNRVSFVQSYLFCALGYASHGVLDACTTYGTQLFWPFSDARIAWDNVSVVDPLFTLPLGALVLIGLYTRVARYAAAGVCWTILYLGLGVIQNERAVAAGAELARSRGHTPVRVEAKPAFANLLVWKVIYEYDGRYFVDAVRVGRQTKVFEGVSVAKLDVDRDLPWLDRDSQQARDLERFRWFADDFLAVDPGRPGFVIDIRYSLVPNSIDSLWAIVLKPGADPAAHVRYVTMRARTLAEGGLLFDMILP
jgi:inner membrane protein